MSEALPFAEIELRSLQGFLCALALSDVLGGTEHFIRSPRCISFHSTQTLDSPHFAGGPNDPMFRVRVHSATNGLLSCPENLLSIVRMDYFANHCDINGTFLRSQPVDAIEFVRPNYPIRIEVPIIVAHVRDALGLFKPGFAFL